MYATIWHLFPLYYEEDGTPMYETHAWYCATEDEFNYAMEVLSEDVILKIEY